MAKKFQFRLEPVLKLRTHKVNEAKEELRQVVDLRVRKERSIAEREDYFNQLLRNRNLSCKAWDLQADSNHRNYIKEEIEKLKKEKNQLLEIEGYKKEKLTNAMKQEKILEKLKEKKHEVFNETLQKDEMKVIDEIAINRNSKKDNQ